MFNPVLVVGTRSQLLESRKLRVISLLPFGFFFLYKDFYVGKGGGRERRRVAIKHFILSFRDDRVLVDVLRILLHAQSGRKVFPSCSSIATGMLQRGLRHLGAGSSK